MSIIRQVNDIMAEVQEKEKKELDFEKIEPFDEECKFGKNGLWLFIGPQGSGKTHKLIETILFTEMIYEKPYFDNIIFCSTSEALDKTLELFKKKIKTKIEFVPEDKLLERMKLHIKRKAKFYSMMKYVTYLLSHYAPSELHGSQVSSSNIHSIVWTQISSFSQLGS